MSKPINDEAARVIIAGTRQYIVDLSDDAKLRNENYPLSNVFEATIMYRSVKVPLRVGVGRYAVVVANFVDERCEHVVVTNPNRLDNLFEAISHMADYVVDIRSRASER